MHEARNKWIKYLINFTEAWGKIIEAKKKAKKQNITVLE